MPHFEIFRTFWLAWSFFLLITRNDLRFPHFYSNWAAQETLSTSHEFTHRGKKTTRSQEREMLTWRRAPVKAEGWRNHAPVNLHQRLNSKRKCIKAKSVPETLSQKRFNIKKVMPGFGNSMPRGSDTQGCMCHKETNSWRSVGKRKVHYSKSLTRSAELQVSKGVMGLNVPRQVL